MLLCTSDADREIDAAPRAATCPSDKSYRDEERALSIALVHWHGLGLVARTTNDRDELDFYVPVSGLRVSDEELSTKSQAPSRSA